MSDFSTHTHAPQEELHGERHEGGEQNVEVSRRDARRPENGVLEHGGGLKFQEGTDPAVKVVARADIGGEPAGLRMVSLGAVLLSMQRGWSATLTASQQDYPYNAYVYLTRALINACQGVRPTLTTAPYWFWVLVDSFAPKTVRFRTGSIAYQWDVGVPTTYVPSSTVLNQQQGYLGHVNTALLVNLWPTVVQGVYDAQVAQGAIQSLFDFYEAEGRMLERTPRSSTEFVQDTSAFAGVSALFGRGLESETGLSNAIYSEVFVDCPILAKIAPFYPSQLYQGRGVTQIFRSGGGPSYIVPRMMEMQDVREMKNRTAPLFKAYNFDEFVETLALTLAMAVDLAYVAGTVVGTCPMSFQEFQLILRQNLVLEFSNHMYPDMFVKVGEFEALTVTTNGLSITAQTCPMKFPQLFAENVRATGRVLSNLAQNTSQHALDVVPILGRYKYAMPPSNYQTSQGIVLFNPVPGEAAVEMINLYAGAVAQTIDANGSRLVELTERYNRWVTSLGSWLSPLTYIGEEEAISALLTGFSTLHLVRLPEPELPQQRREEKKPLGMGTKLAVADPIQPLGYDAFNFMGTIAITSTYKYLTSVYKFHKLMILPVAMYGEQYLETVEEYQVTYSEPYRINQITREGISLDRSEQQGGMTLYERHMMMAQADVRTNLAPATEMQVELDALVRMGRGGGFTEEAEEIAKHMPGIPRV